MLRYAVRSIYPNLAEFAEEKFVLVSGPRQVGKTTLAKYWLKQVGGGSYLNWDDTSDRASILRRAFLESTTNIVADELHKYRQWKIWLKALYDKHAAELRMVVTGSARLEVFQKSGDSLLGRYERLRLHPFSIGELSHGSVPSPPVDWLTTGHQADENVWRRLLRRSGFPEPYTRDESRHHNRWRQRRRDLLLHQDLRELSDIRLISQVEHLALLLPERVGAPLSLNGLREELSVAHQTVASWVTMLERLYYCFRIYPYHRKIARSLKKEPKLYLWDWTEIEEPGQAYENCIAMHLLKCVHLWTDLGFGEFDLGYLRTRDSEEVDFVITNRRRPVVLVEVKTGTTKLSPILRKYSTLLGVPGIQLVEADEIDERGKGVRVVTASKLLCALP